MLGTDGGIVRFQQKGGGKKEKKNSTCMYEIGSKHIIQNITITVDSTLSEVCPKLFCRDPICS